MNFSIIPGIATIITGPEGSGKTRLARKAAGTFGSFIETTMREISHSPFSISDKLSSLPNTVIVEEFDGSKDLEAAKMLAFSKSMIIHERMKPSRSAGTPNFIFISQLPMPLRHGLDERRFMIIEL